MMVGIEFFLGARPALMKALKYVQLYESLDV
jgi:hypothetical protein